MEEMETQTDPAFWRSAYQVHGAALLGYLSSRLRRRDEAEDILHETFVRAIRAGDALRDTTRVRPYLFSIAHRLLINQGRKKRPLLFAEISDDGPGFTAAIEDGMASNPADEAHFGILRRRIEVVLEMCPADHARAFRLALFEQKSYAEIADSEGWALN